MNEDWDYEHAKVHGPVIDGYSVVSVRLRRSELAAIAEQARIEGVSTSRFLRESALKNSGRPAVWVRLKDGMSFTT